MRYKGIELKDGLRVEDLMYLDPRLIIVLGHLTAFCFQNNIQCKLTSLSTDYVEGRKSTTHLEGRAFDLSIIHWPKQKVTEMKDYLLARVGQYGAYSTSDGKKRLIVIHNVEVQERKLGVHAHIQVSKNKEY